MELVGLVATDIDGAIGIEGRLPWRLPSDLKRFKQRTMGSPIIMGRKTWDSIGRALPGRLNIVLSRSAEIDGIVVARSPEAAISACGSAKEAFIIGGGEIYKLFKLDTLELTIVQTKVESADTYFEIPKNMKLISEELPIQEDGDEFPWVLKILKTEK